MTTITKLATAVFLGFALSTTLVHGTTKSLDDDFLAAREYYRAGEKSKLDKIAGRLAAYPLQPYVEYWQLRLRLEDGDAKAVQSFLHRHRDSLLAERLRSEWLKLLGKRQQWSGFGEMYSEVQNEDTELLCYGLQYRRLYGVEALKEAQALWLNGQETADSCTPLFDELFSLKKLRTADIWARFRLAAEAGNLTLARELNAMLPESERIDAKLLEKAHHDPEIFLGKHDFKMKTVQGRELFIYASQRAARNVPLEAKEHFLKWRDKLPIADARYLQGQLAFHAARRLLPEALTWYREADGAPLNDQQLAWKARAALRAPAWTDVLDAIHAMSISQQQDSAWRYWKARALKEMGRDSEAQPLLSYLSQEHHFYGLLASEELGQHQTIRAETSKPAAEAIQAMENRPGIARALKLFRLAQTEKALRLDAIREWNAAVRPMNDTELLIAAEVARRHQWYDRTISTADRTILLHDFGLRYLAPYREPLSNAAREQGLEEAFVLGLVRQESRFIADAISSAGAVGLMQLMPPTAKWVAKKLRKNDYRPSHIGGVDINVQFGTFYLREVLDRLEGHPLLAAAAYNAGPGRAHAWRASKPLEGAIYAETIPFNETRDYVKKVLANSVYYAQVLGRPNQPLKQRLGTVPARKVADLFAGAPADRIP